MSMGYVRHEGGIGICPVSHKGTLMKGRVRIGSSPGVGRTQVWSGVGRGRRHSTVMVRGVGYRARLMMVMEHHDPLSLSSWVEKA